MRRILRDLAGSTNGEPAVEIAWRTIAKNVTSVDQFWLGNTYRWWFDVIDLDPLPDYLALNIPILIGVGGSDRSVPVGSALSLQAEFEKVGKSNITVLVYPGAGHMLTTRTVSFRSDFFREVTLRFNLGHSDSKP